MVCVYCGSETQVINSRLQKHSNQVWRRRKCRECQAVFTTHETAHYTDTWLIQTPKSHLEPFSRDKLFLSLYDSTQHRKTALKDAAALTDTVISSVRDQGKAGIIPTLTLKRAIQVILNRFDKIASTHYAAFHKD